jgi:putative phosphoserine phosphatase/1-acylglycerol-3-phosphate O-acyltransferase
MNRRRPLTAAIFDLDRTLVAGATGPAFARHLDAAGVRQRHLPGADLVAATYRTLGETALTSQAARLAARATAGWPTEAVEAAARAAVDDLMEQVQPYVPIVLEEHREAGRVLVMATTSPASLVTPFAERLGFDDVVATKWVIRDGAYTGELDGGIVWGRGKLEAVQKWAADAGVDLGQSYAYSDSYYDAPLLDAVKYPTAVNADLRLVALARLKGWRLRHFDLPDGVLKIAGRELQAWTRPLQDTRWIANVEFDVEGVEKIPAHGPVIVVFNHRSYFDATAVGAVLGRTGRSFRFLGKKEVFDAPVIGFLSKMAGGIRVNRASGSSEPLEHAIRALKAGEAVALAPEGTIPRGPAFFEPELKGRWGAARLAQATRAPVIPVGLWGTERVWPRNARLPKFDLLGERPVIRVRVGDPVPLKYRSLEADTKRIMAALVDQLPPEARVRRTPTAEELAATYPPGYRGDPMAEVVRRPGTDT